MPSVINIDVLSLIRLSHESFQTDFPGGARYDDLAVPDLRWVRKARKLAPQKESSSPTASSSGVVLLALHYALKT